MITINDFLIKNIKGVKSGNKYKSKRGFAMRICLLQICLVKHRVLYKMMNLLSKTHDFIKMINLLSKANDFTKNDKFV